MNAKRIVLGGLAVGRTALRSRRDRQVLAVALFASSMGPACGSSSGSPSHDASSGATDASGSGAGSDGSTEASSSSGGPGGSDAGDGSGADASSGDSGGQSDGGGADIQKPGPSAQLFNNPYYQCLRNFYVSTGGHDADDGTSPGTAWATIANADTSDRQGGDCINVAPGTYPHFNSNMTHGGTTASSTGYVAYRCTTPVTGRCPLLP